MAIDYEVETMASTVGYLAGFGRRLADMAPECAKRYCRNPDPRSGAYEIIHLGCPYNPRDWTEGRMTEVDRQRFSRAVKSLARFGLIIPYSRGTKTSHLRLTPRGVRVGIAALRRVGEEPDVEAIARGLAAVEWATAEHLDAVRFGLPKETPAADEAGEDQQTETAAPAAKEEHRK